MPVCRCGLRVRLRLRAREHRRNVPRSFPPVPGPTLCSWYGCMRMRMRASLCPTCLHRYTYTQLHVEMAITPLSPTLSPQLPTSMPAVASFSLVFARPPRVDRVIQVLSCLPPPPRGAAYAYTRTHTCMHTRTHMHAHTHIRADTTVPACLPHAYTSHSYVSTPILLVHLFIPLLQLSQSGETVSISRGYRKVAGNSCEGGIDALMAPMPLQCPCSEWSSWSVCDSCM